VDLLHLRRALTPMSATDGCTACRCIGGYVIAGGSGELSHASGSCPGLGATSGPGGGGGGTLTGFAAQIFSCFHLDPLDL
jgi:hypothetical protein